MHESVRGCDVFLVQTTCPQDEKIAMLCDHFASIFGVANDRPRTLNLDGLNFNTCDLDHLSEPISFDEAKAAMFDLHPEKAPGPDGFTGLFFRVCWNTIKDDLMAAIRKFEGANGQNLQLLNSSTLVLIPKINGANQPKDFRPISLLHSFSKLFAKILAARLQPHMNSLIQQCQNAFIRGRSIHDNFVYVQSLAKSLKQKKIPAVLLKLDISKAFDSVSWEFLLQLLQARGFPRKWCDWITIMLLTCSSRILVNGDLSPNIQYRRGLRQGDPLSPLLFILVMDCLGRLMDRANDAGILSSLGSQPLKFRTSLYADDVMIFLKPTLHDIRATSEILNLFADATGLRTNYAKSNLIPIRCDDIDLQPLQAELGCPLAAFPCTYLGMPLSDSRLRRIDYQHIIDKIIAKLSGWKIAWLTNMGRLILMRVVLSALPTYQMMVIANPKWMEKTIDKIRRGFLWTGKLTAHGGKCLVRWDNCCRPLEHGGLGIPVLSFQSTALRLRWIWQQHTNPSKPWVGLNFPCDPTVRSLFVVSTAISIGDGRSFSFWHSHWLGGLILKNSYPDLFKHSRGSKLTIAEALINNNWIRCIKPNPEFAVLAQFTDLWRRLQDVQLTPDMADSIRWRWTADGQYSARSAYQIQFEGLHRSNFADLIWRNKVQPKVQFFTWLALRGRCSTADILQKKSIPHNPICSLCRIHPETAVHLLARCSIAREVLGNIFQHFAINAAPRSADEAGLES